jgi:carbon monoxide dehydrogenase subunit G
MQIQGERRIAAPREAVWRALNDPDILRIAIPGCDSLNRLSETEFESQLTAKIGPVKATFGGKVTLSEIDPPSGYTLSGEGKGAAGFAKGSAVVRLRDESGTTILSYEAAAQVGGRLAQVGGRLIEGTTRKLADAFFDAFAQQVSMPAVAPSAAEAQMQATPEPSAPSAEPAKPAPSTEPSLPAKGGLSPMAWIMGTILVVLALLWFFALQ